MAVQSLNESWREMLSGSQIMAVQSLNLSSSS